jgi:hypothetical protein
MLAFHGNIILLAPCWRRSLLPWLAASQVNLVIKYLQDKNYNRKQNSIGQDNQCWVEVLDPHTYKSLAIVSTFWLLVIPTFVFSANETDFPEPPSPVNIKHHSTCLQYMHVH